MNKISPSLWFDDQAEEVAQVYTSVFRNSKELGITRYGKEGYEIHLWSKLSDGADENAQQCGWLNDKFGVPWQVVPSVLSTLLSDPEKSEKVMKALLGMKKLDLKTFEQA